MARSILLFLVLYPELQSDVLFIPVRGAFSCAGAGSVQCSELVGSAFQLYFWSHSIYKARGSLENAGFFGLCIHLQKSTAN